MAPLVDVGAVRLAGRVVSTRHTFAEIALAPTAAAQRWCIITSEYPPHAGGVSDHTFLLARALADAGDMVEVWTPPDDRTPTEQPGVTVHVLPSCFKLDALKELRHVLHTLPAETRVLVQYVPTSFGWRMMNLPFAWLLYTQRWRGLDIYFHEVGFVVSRRQRMRRNIAGLVHLVMNWLTVRSAARVFVAIPEWERRLRRLGLSSSDPDRLVTWVPVPSNVPDTADAERVRAIRDDARVHGATSIVGHFGTFGRYHMAILLPTIVRVLDDGAARVMLLIGRNSAAMRDALLAERPDLSARIVATGGLEPQEVSAHVAACDVLLQPYDDGASARRGSLMAGLALGRAIVANRGFATGAVFAQRRAVYLTNSADPDVLSNAVETLLAEPDLRQELGTRARELHNDLFALSRGVTRLRNAASYSEPKRKRARRLAETTAQTLSARVPREPSEPAPQPDSAVRSVEVSKPAIAVPVPMVHGPRVLMLHTTLPTPGRKPGGVEVAVHRLANALVSLGVPVTVASLTEAPADARYAHRHLFSKIPWLRDSRLGRLVVLPLLLNFIRVGNADVVHFHGDDWFVLRRPRPTIRTLHGSALREAQRATRWQRRLLQYVVYPLEHLASRLATITVAVGEDAAGLHAIRRVIGNGVDPELFTPGRKTDVPTVLYVGTLEGRKRGRWMYDMFTEHVVPRHPDAVLHFIADEAPPAHPRVRFTRFPSDVTLAQAYREAWVFALPSTYEGFGIPYLEAMSSGTVVLATPNTGARELLGNGQFGVLAEDAVFGEALLRLLRDDNLRRRIAFAATVRSIDFTWSNVARAYLDLYGEALRRRHGFPSSRDASADLAADGLLRELPDAGPQLTSTRFGANRNLTLVAEAHWLASPGTLRLQKWLDRLLKDAVTMIDIGSGNGTSIVQALSRSDVRYLLAFETDRARRDVIRRVLAPNGLATDPRLTLSGLAVGASEDGATTTLDALIRDARWPLVIRVAVDASDAALSQADAMLAQDSTRWLVGVTAESRAALIRRFTTAGYVVRTLRTGVFGRKRRWLIAWHSADTLPPW